MYDCPCDCFSPEKAGQADVPRERGVTITSFRVRLISTQGEPQTAAAAAPSSQMGLPRDFFLLSCGALACAASSALPGLRPDTCQDVSNIDVRSAGELLDLARPLTRTPFFSIFHVSVDAPCPFWEDEAGKCAMRECSVCDCPENQVPVLWRAADSAASAKLRSDTGVSVVGGLDWGGGERQEQGAGGEKVAAAGVKSERTGFFPVPASVSGLGCEPADGDADTLNDIDRSYSKAKESATTNWAAPAAPDDWIAQDAPDADLLYVDLLKNPERYTGFTGEEAHRVWSAIYDENCISISSNCKDGICAPGTCKEERVFYRLISGVHTSITMHIAADYLYGNKWGRNLEIFATRVRAHREYVENLYMALAVVLRAVAKAAPSLDPSVFSYATGDDVQDRNTEGSVRRLLDHPSLARGCEKLVFDESDMFVASARERLPEFRGAFRNISMIMDCVGCEKCRLWGKLQFLGLGTALRILFTGNDQQELKRNEVIALVNMLHKLLSSVVWVDELNAQLEAQARLRGMLGRVLGVVAIACVCILISQSQSSNSGVRERKVPSPKAKPKPAANGGTGGKAAKAIGGDAKTAAVPGVRRRPKAAAD